MRHSALSGLLEGTDYKQIRTRREALIYYISGHYLPILSRARYQVLYTIPLAAVDVQRCHSSTLTAVKFQILPFSHSSSATVSRQSIIHDRNSVVFLGMTDCHLMPQGQLPRGINWVCGTKDQYPQGAICIARHAFLECSVLAMLEIINRNTTVVPHFSGVHDGEWFLELTTWAKHERLINLACLWKQLPADSDCLNFDWKNRDEWRYEHEGDSSGSGLYTVKCKQHSTLSFDGLLAQFVFSRSHA